LPSRADQLADLRAAQVAVHEQHLLHLAERAREVERQRGLAFLGHRRGDHDDLVRLVERGHQHAGAHRADRLGEGRLRVVEESELGTKPFFRKPLIFCSTPSAARQAALDVAVELIALVRRSSRQRQQAPPMKVAIAAMSDDLLLVRREGADGVVAGSMTRATVLCRSPAALVSFSRFTNMS
jgi:hypothetical protein